MLFCNQMWTNKRKKLQKKINFVSKDVNIFSQDRERADVIVAKAANYCEIYRSIFSLHTSMTMFKCKTGEVQHG